MKRSPIVAVKSFIEATRDAGYKSTGSAIAELVDNALEAEATHVDVSIHQADDAGGDELAIRVADDGCGMTPEVLLVALQFGGSTRFGSRNGTGRYGMGLPNGGLSQARRLEVYTWTRGSQIWSSYLDVDEIVSGSMRTVPRPKCADLVRATASGTIVVLRKCDRVDTKHIGALEDALAAELGRIFRKFLHAGKQIRINGRRVRPLDPLFVNPGSNITGAKLYGPPLEFNLRVPMRNKRVSVVSAVFSELPLEKWHGFSNEKKNKLGISKGAGVSIVRAGREIDIGWYFMGSKRKENYDDWWRCEINFPSDLDELFGVTHSKQKINPTESLSSILTPEVERIARELNSRVRRKYASIKSRSQSNGALKRFEARDHLLEPPYSRSANQASSRELREFTLLRKRLDGVNGLRFSLTHRPEEHNAFFSAQLRKGLLSLNINEAHPFYSAAYHHLNGNGSRDPKEAAHCLLLLLVSFARAELVQRRAGDRKIMTRLREVWSDTVAAFLS